VSRPRRLIGWFAGLVLVAATGAWFFLLSPLQAVDFVNAACPDACATLDEDALTVPGDAATGLIVYTGARVVPEAYAPVVERVAAAGYPVFVPQLTLNFAIFDADAADAVIADHPEIDRWVIAGHSLGGVMAARYAAGNPEIQGLVLWGSYPEQSLDLSGADLVVSSIYASEDALSTPAEVLAAEGNLPLDAAFVEIEGGNHAQFGNYGPQRGDGTATIDPGTQWDEVAEASIAAIERVDSAPR
jgi:dienelactone hydrolase